MAKNGHGFTVCEICMEKLACWAIFEACFCTRYEKEKKKDISVVRIVNDVITKKGFLMSLRLSMSKMRVMKVIKKTFLVCLVPGHKNILPKKNYKENVFCHDIYL